MVRIRYNRNENNVLVSKQIQAAHDLVTVEIDGLSYRILSSTKEVIDAGESANQHLLKKTIKDSLKSHGVMFLDEVRRKKTIKENTDV